MFAAIALLLTSFSSRVESDWKRVVACSTVIMVCYIWLVWSLSMSSVAFVVAVVHASYKSAVFVTTGRMLSQAVCYSDHVTVAASFKSFLGVIGIVVLGLKSTGYANSKHVTDLICHSSSTSFVLAVITALPVLAF